MLITINGNLKKKREREKKDNLILREFSNCSGWFHDNSEKS